MKMFATDIKGKRIMSTEGEILGEIESLVCDPISGCLEHLLVIPSENVDPKLYKIDSEGRLVLNFGKIKSIKDVVMIEV